MFCSLCFMCFALLFFFPVCPPSSPAFHNSFAPFSSPLSFLFSIFFGRERIASQSRSPCHCTHYLPSNSTSSESGLGPPPVWHQETPQAGADSDAAKDTAHVVANMRVHRRSHIKATRNCMFEGNSPFGEREHPDNLDSFLAPSSSCLDGKHDQFASA